MLPSDQIWPVRLARLSSGTLAGVNLQGPRAGRNLKEAGFERVDLSTFGSKPRAGISGTAPSALRAYTLWNEEMKCGWRSETELGGDRGLMNLHRAISLAQMRETILSFEA